MRGGRRGRGGRAGRGPDAGDCAGHCVRADRPADAGGSLSANGLWLKTRVKAYNGTNAAGQPQNFDGAEFIYSPKFQGSVTAVYDTPLTDNLNLVGAVSARYQGKSNTVFENLPLYRIDAFAVVNASIGVKSGNGWSASIWGSR